VDAELASALDDLILGRGVARGRHDLILRGKNVAAEFEQRLAANGFSPTLVREAQIEPGERVPAFRIDPDTTKPAADFGWIRWEIFTPRSRRKLFASERRRADNLEWAIQIAPGSSEAVWACPERREKHDVETVVAVNP
jgi:hypothetical protein